MRVVYSDVLILMLSYWYSYQTIYNVKPLRVSSRSADMDSSTHGKQLIAYAEYRPIDVSISHVNTKADRADLNPQTRGLRVM